MKKRYNKIQHTKVLLLIVYLLIIGIIILTGKLNKIITFAIFAFILVIFYKYRSWHVKRYLEANFTTIDRMSGEEFEEFLQIHFDKQGYKTYLTPLKCDYGADIVLKKKGIKTTVQAKRWKTKVGIEAVQQAVASVKYYKANNAIVVTNSTFTINAINLARANDVLLIDRNSLKDFLDDKNYKLCPKCNSKLRIVKGKFGDFYGCSNFPRCNYTKST